MHWCNSQGKRGETPRLPYYLYLLLKIKNRIMKTYSKNTVTEQCTIPSVSGSISIKKNNDKGQLKLVSNSNWFDSEYVIVNKDEDCIIINKPTLDYTGRMFKVMKIGLNSLIKLSLELPMGKFEFDTDESTEDELVVYYR